MSLNSTFRAVLSALVVLLIVLPSTTAYAKDFPEDYKEMLDLLGIDKKNFNHDSHIIREAVQYLVAYPSYEALDAIRLRLELEVGIAIHTKDVNTRARLIMISLLSGIQKLGNAEDLDAMYAIAKTIEDLRVEDTALFAAINETITTLDHPHHDFPELESAQESMEAVAQLKYENHELAEKEAIKATGHTGILERFTKRMEKTVVGQSEIIEGLGQVVLKDLLLGNNQEKPDVVYIIGSPDDSIVNAFVDGLHDKDGAYQDHLFKIEATTSAEIWAYLGSTTGYIGSDQLPPLLKKLVEHSGGKYRLAEDDSGHKPRQVVELNPDYKSDKLSLTSTKPQKLVIRINKFHKVPNSVKDEFLLKAIEEGVFPIKNPGSTEHSATEIKLPVKFVITSSEGIELIEPRASNGTRIGQPLTYEEILQNWKKVHEDKRALKKSIEKTNGRKNNSSDIKDSPGISEDFLRAVPNRNLYIVKPGSPEDLQEIARRELAKEFNLLAKNQGSLGQFKVSFSDDLIRYIQEHNYVPSDVAPPVLDRAREFVVDPFYWAIKKGKIPLNGKQTTIGMDIKTYNSGAASVVFNIRQGKGPTKQFHRLLRSTLRLVPATPITDDRIEEILDMKDEINKNVFGVEPIVDKMVRNLLISEAEGKEKATVDTATRKANLIGFFGKTSVGKTELAKQYTIASRGSVEELVIIDFNKVTSVKDMKIKISGDFDERGNYIKSEFMEAYDRKNGNLVFVFDEISNAPLEALKLLYDIFREPVVRDFSDGEPRMMGNVDIILTGNVGDIIYRNIPSLPADMLEIAQLKAYDAFLNNPNHQYQVLLQYFTDAMIARMGQNIYWLSPLRPKSKRQLSQLKLQKALQAIEPTASQRGWNIKFSSQEDLNKLLDILEAEGFTSEHQGAALDTYIQESFKNVVKYELLKSNVANKSQITLSVPEKNEVMEQNLGRFERKRKIVLTTEDGKNLDVLLPAKDGEFKLEVPIVSRVLTAYHEVGHELVTRVYWGDAGTTAYLTIIPGVSIIGNEYVYYGGLKVSIPNKEVELTKEAILRHVAVLTAGYVAEDLVSVGQKTNSGKGNDTMRATAIIYEGILRLGLSKEWGVKSIPDSQMSVGEFTKNHLSDEERNKLNNIVRRWLSEGEALAREAIMMNYGEYFVPLGHLLAAEGHLNHMQINEFYKKHPMVTERDERYLESREEYRRFEKQIITAVEGTRDFHKKFNGRNYDPERAQEAYNYIRGEKGTSDLPAWGSLKASQKLVAVTHIARQIQDRTRDAKLHSTKLIPKKVADIDELVEQQRLNEIGEVSQESLMSRLITKDAHSSKVGRCNRALTKK